MEKSTIFGFLHRLFRFLDFCILYFYNLTHCWFIHLYHTFTRYYSPDMIDSSGVLHITRGYVILKEKWDSAFSHKKYGDILCIFQTSILEILNKSKFFAITETKKKLFLLKQIWRNNKISMSVTRPKHKYDQTREHVYRKKCALPAVIQQSISEIFATARIPCT